MRKVRMDPDSLTIGDMEAFEDFTGLDLMEVLQSTPVIDPETGMPKPDPDPAAKGRPLMEFKITAKAFRGLLFIALKKEDPNLNIETFRQIKISDIDFDLEESSNLQDAEKEKSEEQSA